LIVEQETDVIYTKELFEGKGPEYVKSLRELVELSREERHKDLTKTIAEKRCKK
jgi:hypothetical protein